jgi:hypothetical protein
VGSERLTKRVSLFYFGQDAMKVSQ